MGSRVNEKLYHARLLLQHAPGEEGVAQLALLQGVLFHLMVAYRAFLRELAGSATAADPIDAGQLQVALQREQRRVPGIDELAALEKAGDWPAQMLAAYSDACATSAAVVAPSSPDVIAAVQLGDRVDMSGCERWLVALQGMVERQREFLQEW